MSEKWLYDISLGQTGCKGINDCLHFAFMKIRID